MQGMIAQDGASLVFPTSFGYFDPHILALAPSTPTCALRTAAGSGTKPSTLRAWAASSATSTRPVPERRRRGAREQEQKLGFIAQAIRRCCATSMHASRWARSVTEDHHDRGLHRRLEHARQEAEATNSLADQGVDVFTMHVDGPKVIVETAAKRGKFVCGYHASQAAGPAGLPDGAEWNWITAYKQIIEALPKRASRTRTLCAAAWKDGFVKSSGRQRRA